jgi:hypothetical protein
MVEVSDLLIYWIKSYTNSKCEKCKKKSQNNSPYGLMGSFWLVLMRPQEKFRNFSLFLCLMFYLKTAKNCTSLG